MTWGLQATAQTPVGVNVWLGDPARAPAIVQGDIGGMQRAETGGVVLLFSRSPEYAVRWDTKEQAESMALFLPSVFRFTPMELPGEQAVPMEPSVIEQLMNLSHERIFAPSATPTECALAPDRRHYWAHFDRLTTQSMTPTFYCQGCAIVISFEDFLAWGRTARAAPPTAPQHEYYGPG